MFTHKKSKTETVRAVIW